MLNSNSTNSAMTAFINNYPATFKCFLDKNILRIFDKYFNFFISLRFEKELKEFGDFLPNLQINLKK